MAYTDWTFYLSANTQAQIVLTGQSGEPDAPVGDGWLKWSFTGVGGSGNAVPQDPPYAFGLLRGAYRSLLAYGILGGAEGNNRLGLLCMQNQDDMRATNGGTAYGVFLGTDQHIRLEKLTNGLGNTSVLLAENLDDLWTYDTPVALELAWDATPQTVAILGGVVLSVRIGSALDFSNLADVPGLVNYVDTSSPYTTTVMESLAIFHQIGTPYGYCDQTQLIGP